MISPAESLLKYDKAVLVRGAEKPSPKGRHLKVSPHQTSKVSPVPPPKPKSTLTESNKQEHEDILNTILPPREWVDGNKVWLQKVSCLPCTREDVIHTEEMLNTKLEQRQARETGICPVRRELYTQCFDELIRQETINCAERGLLVLRVRDEIQVTMAALKALYEGSVAFGMRKALQAEQNKAELEKKISILEYEQEDVTKQLNEAKAKCDTTEKREKEKAEILEKKHNEEIQFLKKSIQQLQNYLDAMIPKR